MTELFKNPTPLTPKSTSNPDRNPNTDPAPLDLRGYKRGAVFNPMLLLYLARPEAPTLLFLLGPLTLTLTLTLPCSR